MIERELYKYLQTQSSITDIVGTHIYADRRPPAAAATSITIQAVSAIHHYSVAGEVDLVQPDLQVDCWAKGPGAYERVSDLFEKLRVVISGFRGTWGATAIAGCTFGNRIYSAEPPADGTQYHTHRVGATITVSHQQVATTFT